MRLLSPTVNGPSTFAPVEISTLLPMVGWRLPVSLPVPPEGDAVVDGAVVTDLGGLADDDAHAVVDEQALADLRAGMDLDTGHMPRKLRKRTREEKKACADRASVPGGGKTEHGSPDRGGRPQRGARRRVAVADRASVVEQAFEDHNTDIHSLEIKRTSRFAENTM